MANVTLKSQKEALKSTIKDQAILDLIDGARTKKAFAEVVETIEKKGNKPTPKRSIHETAYGKEVLKVNSELKAFTKTYKGALSLLFCAMTEKSVNMSTKQRRILREAKKNNKVMFKQLEELTKPHSSGSYSPFYVLQAIRRNEEDLLNLCK
jgi:hypothetical protein